MMLFEGVFRKMRQEIILAVFKYKNGFDRTILKEVNVLSADKGGCTALFTVTERNCDDRGHLANGFSTTLMDSLTSVGLTTILHTKSHVSVVINMRYFQPVRIGEEVLIKTAVSKLGKNVAFLEAEFQNSKTKEIVAEGSQIKFISDRNVFL